MCDFVGDVHCICASDVLRPSVGPPACDWTVGSSALVFDVKRQATNVCNVLRKAVCGEWTTRDGSHKCVRVCACVRACVRRAAACVRLCDRLTAGASRCCSRKYILTELLARVAVGKAQRFVQVWYNLHSCYSCTCTPGMTPEIP